MIRFILSHFFLFCLVLLGSVFYYLTMTETGLQTDIQLAKKLLPGKLTLAQAHGKLFSQFELRDIFYQSDKEYVQIKSVAIAWKPVGLLLHKLMFRSIILNDAIIFY